MNPRRTILAAAAAASLAMGAAPLGSPASAAQGPAAESTTETLTDYIKVWGDLDNRLVAFVNITRDAYCTPDTVAHENWWAANQGGDPAKAPKIVDKTGLKPVTLTLTKDGGYTLAEIDARRIPIELYRLERDKTSLEQFRGPCSDSDRVVDGTKRAPDPQLFATGPATIIERDNDDEHLGRQPEARWTIETWARVSGPRGSYNWDHSFTETRVAGEEPSAEFGATLTRRGGKHHGHWGHRHGGHQHEGHRH